MDVTNFFDLYDLFVNELSGSIWIFIFISLITIWLLAIKSKISTEVAILLSALFLAIIFIQGQMMIIWIFLVLFTGVFFYFKIANMAGR